jgi:predicted phosphohydrolase
VRRMIFAIADLHLSESAQKPMDIFGPRWENHFQRLNKNWRATVGPDDTVIIPGDVSWATYISQIREDFKFIDGLPGHKLISKGNHDYWWTTQSKISKFLTENDFGSIRVIHNNSYIIDGTAICGTRGWTIPGEADFSAEDDKIYKRELLRLEMSLDSLQGDYERIVVALHFPPFSPNGGKTSGFIDIMKKHKVDLCLFGHIHNANAAYAAEKEIDGIRFRLVAADSLDFTPLLISNA